MTQNDPQPDEQPQEATEVPMNRAQRRAMATGKKSGGNSSTTPHQANMPGVGNRGSSVAGQAKIQTRGANRGK